MLARLMLSPVLAMVLLLLLLFSAGCLTEAEPIKLGFVGGLSGANADLGHAGRNGVLLAVDEINRSGGINGRPVVLKILDDENTNAGAVRAAESLIDEKVEAIIGPFTTTMAEAVMPVCEAAGMLLFSPTSSSAKFSGKDDLFFRICSTTVDNGGSYASFMCKIGGERSVSVVLDEKNYTFVKTWLDAFKNGIRDCGIKIVSEVWYNAESLSGYGNLVEKITRPEPDAIVLVANAVNVARLVQQIRKADKTTKIYASEWASTQQLIELGGKAVDGVQVLHLFNEYGTEEDYVRFKNEYKKQFKSDPSFSSILAYESVKVVLKAIVGRKDGQSLKESILANNPYPGLQGVTTIDEFGDSVRETFFVVVNGTKFLPVAK